MENRSHALLAGLFTLLLGVAVVLAVLWFRGDTLGTERYLLVSSNSVSGLTPQAAVRYRGVAVGKVESIGLDPLNPRTVLVEISVDKTTPITTATFAQLGYQGVTGLSYVKLDDDSRQGEPLAPTPESMARIELRPSLLDQVGSSGQELIASINEIGDRVKLLLSDENRAHVVNTLESLDRAASHIADVAADLQPAVQALPALTTQIEQTLEPLPDLLAHLDRSVRTLPRLSKDASQALQGADQAFARLERLAGEISQRVDTLNSVAASADRVADSVNSFGKASGDIGSALLGSTLPQLERLIADLQDNSQRLDRLLIEWREQPQSLLFGSSARVPGPGERGYATPAETRQPGPR
ncbi:MAG: MCE family protein [Burkholderiales bacterium]|nr:MCE family protein [Burkholderiales bacterium]